VVDNPGTPPIPAPVSSTIVILDFGSQYTQLIARRIREFNVFSVVLPCTTPIEKVLALNPVGIVLSGGPSSVYDESAPKADPAILTTGLPILGICYGLQFITHEYGHAEVTVTDPATLFHGLPETLSVWMSHGDHAEALAPGFRVTASTSNAIAAIADESRKMWAVQFHPEVAHTKHGMALLKNFAVDICGAKQDWTPEHFIASTVAKIREQVGPTGQAICGLSGGVDSSVAAVLVARAIGKRLTCIFVNNGVLRKDEFAKVQQTMRDELHLTVVAVDASERFLGKLAGVTDGDRQRIHCGV
jgi:GMP synthase (glutamine-hydrolysing)